jgi:hypothetical protein
MFVMISDTVLGELNWVSFGLILVILNVQEPNFNVNPLQNFIKIFYFFTVV